MNIIPSLNFMCFMIQDGSLLVDYYRVQVLHRYEEACKGVVVVKRAVEKEKERFVRDRAQIQ